MFINKLICLCFSVMIYLNIHAQNNAIQGIGGSYFALPKGHALAINYSYRNNFKEVGNGNSLSLAISPSVALHYDAISKEQFLIEAPVLLSYNVGYMATSSARSEMGFFIGAGAGVHYLQQFGFGYGPEYCIGIRGELANKPIELRINYHHDLFSVTSDLISIHLNLILNR
jgi:hypothetical protein